MLIRTDVCMYGHSHTHIYIHTSLIPPHTLPPLPHTCIEHGGGEGQCSGIGVGDSRGIHFVHFTPMSQETEAVDVWGGGRAGSPSLSKYERFRISYMLCCIVLFVALTI